MHSYNGYLLAKIQYLIYKSELSIQAFFFAFFRFFLQRNMNTDSTKIYRPEHNIRMYWTNFRQPTAHVQQIFVAITPIEVCIPHLYASFATIYAKIGQLFETQ